MLITADQLHIIAKNHDTVDSIRNRMLDKMNQKAEEGQFEINFVLDDYDTAYEYGDYFTEFGFTFNILCYNEVSKIASDTKEIMHSDQVLLNISW